MGLALAKNALYPLLHQLPETNGAMQKTLPVNVYTPPPVCHKEWFGKVMKEYRNGLVMVPTFGMPNTTQIDGVVIAIPPAICYLALETDGPN